MSTLASSYKGGYYIVDFNVSTGKFIYTYFDYTNGDYFVNKTKHETYTKKGIRLNLGNRNTKEIRINLPITGKEYYL